MIFDLDGVLADSRRPIIDSVNDTLEAAGLPRRPDEEVVPAIGPPTEVGFAMLLGVETDSPLVEEIVERYRERYADVLGHTRSYAGMPEAVRALARDRRLGVATSKPRRYALPVLEAIGLADCFVVVAGPASGGRQDKHAMVAEALASLPDAAVMVGDRSFDMQAGRAHGLYAIGVTWGFGDRDELAAAGAHELVDAPAELLAAATRASRRTSRDTIGP